MGPGTQDDRVQAGGRGSGLKGCPNPGPFISCATLAEACNVSMLQFPSQKNEGIIISPSLENHEDQIVNMCRKCLEQSLMHRKWQVFNTCEHLLCLRQSLWVH